MLGGSFLFEIDRNAQKLWKRGSVLVNYRYVGSFKTNSSSIRISFGFDPLFPPLQIFLKRKLFSKNWKTQTIFKIIFFS